MTSHSFNESNRYYCGLIWQPNSFILAMIDQNENELFCTQLPYNVKRVIKKLRGFKRAISGIALQDRGHTRSFMKPLMDAGFRVFLATMTINPHCADRKLDSEFEQARFLAQFLKHLDK